MADRPSRKLAAILHADIVGSTELVQRDEAVAHERIRDVFRRFSETISSVGGVPWEIRGDALVAEFSRASDAVTAAVSFQKNNTDSNAQLEDEIRPELRIGISLGEVIVADNTITGAGIVIAQRLEQLAEPGGVVVQGSVSETVPTRLPYDFVSLGEQTLKGFDQPVRAYSVQLRPGGRIQDSEPVVKTLRNETNDAHERGALLLPEKPSIAILPFVNMSGDPEQEYFADGLTEDIITRLSYLRGLYVYDRSSSFSFKGRALRARDAAIELGVRYILQGSVRRAGDRVRIVAQLVDGHLSATSWAQRFDRQLSDVFAIQDEITQSIVIAMQVALTDGEIVRSDPGVTTSVDAWEKFHQGILALLRYTPEDNVRAQSLLDEALVYDPNYIDARVYLAWTYWQDSRSGYTADRSANLMTCRKMVDDLKAMGALTANAKHLEAATLLMEYRHDDALEVSGEAVRMGPCKLFGYTPAALVHFYSGDVQTSLDVLRTTVRIYPYTPSDTVYMIAYSLCLAGDHLEAVNAAEEYMCRVPTDLFAYTLLATAYALSGAMKQARETIANFRKLYPSFTLADFVTHEPFRDQTELRRVVAALREAGLPE